MIQRLFMLAVCGFLAWPAGAAEPLVIAVSRSPLSLPLFVAEHQGYFAAEGLQVRLEEVLGGHRAMQALLEGKADLATVSDTVAMFASFQSKDFAILTSFVSSNDDIKLVTRAGSGIAKVSDLAGKRVGTVPGSANHYYLDTLLLLSGVAPGRIRIVSMQPEAMAQALQNGEVAAVAVWEPYPFKILGGVGNARIVPAQRFSTLTFSLAATRKVIDGGREADLVKLLRALELAEKFIATEPARAQDILKARLGLEQAFVEWIWPSYRYRLSLDQSLLPTLESQARWARKQGHVKAASSPNYLEFIHAAPLRAVSPANVNMLE